MEQSIFWLITRAGRLQALKCRCFLFVFCRRRRRRRTFEISQYGVNADWLVTLFARADHVWAKYMGR